MILTDVLDRLVARPAFDRVCPCVRPCPCMHPTKSHQRPSGASQATDRKHCTAAGYGLKALYRLEPHWSFGLSLITNQQR